METRDIGRLISARWWALLGALGFEKERWEALDPVARRAVKTAFWLVVGLVLVAVGGVWKLTALAAAVIVFALVVTPWRRLPFGKWVVPGAVLALAVLYPKYQSDLFGMPIFGPVGITPISSGFHLPP